MGSTNENLAPAAINSLTKELANLCKEPEEGITVILNEENVADIVAEIDGPEGTPYAGGAFRMKLVLPGDFPNSAPKGYFLTKIFHPNVRQPSGEICVNTLKKDWQPSHGIRHILKVIRCLLIQPFPDSALNEEAAKLLLEDYEEFAKYARMLTSVHARPLETISAEGAGSPTKKKAKADKAKKKGMKRL